MALARIGLYQVKRYPLRGRTGVSDASISAVDRCEGSQKVNKHSYSNQLKLIYLAMDSN